MRVRRASWRRPSRSSSRGQRLGRSTSVVEDLRRGRRGSGRRWRGRAGASTRCSATTPCRPSTTTRSPSTSASSTSWVTNTTVQPMPATPRRAAAASSRGSGRRGRRTARPCRSRRARRPGRGRAAPAAACRRRAGRAAGRRSGPGRPGPATRRRAGAARPRPTPCSASGSSTLRRAVRHGSSASSWKTRARSASGPVTRRAVGDDLAGERAQQAGDGPQQGGLAAAGGAEHDQDLAGRDVEVDALDDRLAGVARGTGRRHGRRTGSWRGVVGHQALLCSEASQRVSRRPSSSTQPEVSQPMAPIESMPTRTLG